jgi:hypothetical protein
MTEVVKLLLQLVKVCGEAKASSSVAQGSAVKFFVVVYLNNTVCISAFINVYQTLLCLYKQLHKPNKIVYIYVCKEIIIE